MKSDIVNSQKPVVAGIIDTKTGEFSEMTCNPSAKARLRLKVRDELNPVHGKDAFVVFEFGGVLGIDRIKRAISSANESAVKELEKLYLKFQIHQSEESLARINVKLSLAKKTLEECLGLYDSKQVAARELIESLFSNEIDEISSASSGVSFTISKQKKMLKQLDNH
ncbi:hypothetical protein [Photobacterium kishitanii]|uniref:Uncharacterized protein n=1 Tax=Photobacterium kishitanii TaxID=318456 RepID=A0A2T3KB09_9GAMM|nr:hypothetical protein [Photobacterium kishitanii]PSU89790.1 hypothetical protein C9J27_24215 [Photobacterium kishitanii]